MKHYVLVGRKPVPVENVSKWAASFADKDRLVGKTKITDSIEVSTVFLGLDHSFGQGGPPILFETMVFGGIHDQDCRRYATWEEAEDGHWEWVARERQALSAAFADEPEDRFAALLPKQQCPFCAKAYVIEDGKADHDTQACRQRYIAGMRELGAGRL